MAETDRSKGRELVLKGLYALECGEITQDKIIEEIIIDDTLPEKIIEFARNYFKMVKEYETEADRAISALAENWEFDRIAQIDKIILRMGMTEIDKMPDIPVKVVINEAIELAKKFSTEKSSGFINGILDNFHKKRLQKESGH